MKYIRVLLFVAVIIAAIFVFQTSRRAQRDVEQSSQVQTTAVFTSERGVEIRVNEPAVGSTGSSPLTVSGEAPGTWYFEATFPISVIDNNGNVIGSSYVQAQSDWMTSEYVPFVGSVEFDEILPLTKGESPGGAGSGFAGEGVARPADLVEKGFLILHRDNPSDLPENDDSVEIPIMFAP